MTTICKCYKCVNLEQCVGVLSINQKQILRLRHKLYDKKQADVDAEDKKQADADAEDKKQTDADVEAKKQADIEAKKQAQYKKQANAEAKKQANAEAKKRAEAENKAKKQNRAKQRTEAIKRAEDEAIKRAEDEAEAIKHAKDEAIKRAKDEVEAIKRDQAEAIKRAEDKAEAIKRAEDKKQKKRKRPVILWCEGLNTDDTIRKNYIVSTVAEIWCQQFLPCPVCQKKTLKVIEFQHSWIDLRCDCDCLSCFEVKVKQNNSDRMCDNFKVTSGSWEGFMIREHHAFYNQGKTKWCGIILIITDNRKGTYDISSIKFIQNDVIKENNNVQIYQKTVDGRDKSEICINKLDSKDIRNLVTDNALPDALPADLIKLIYESRLDIDMINKEFVNTLMKCRYSPDGIKNVQDLIDQKLCIEDRKIHNVSLTKIVMKANSQGINNKK